MAEKQLARFFVAQVHPVPLTIFEIFTICTKSGFSPAPLPEDRIPALPNLPEIIPVNVPLNEVGPKIRAGRD